MALVLVGQVGHVGGDDGVVDGKVPLHDRGDVDVLGGKGDEAVGVDLWGVFFINKICTCSVLL